MSVIRVYIGENSYKSFACKDKTRVSDLMPQILEKFEIPSDHWAKLGFYEKKPDNTERHVVSTDKPHKIMMAWKKEAPGSFWLRTLEGKVVNLAEFVVGASSANSSGNGNVTNGNPTPVNGEVAAPAPKPAVDTSKPKSFTGVSKSENPPEWLSRTKKTAEETEHDKEVWERTQRRAFIGWVNHHLKKRKMEVEDPESDFADGVRLINVLEELCKTKLPAYDPKPRVQIQKVQNLNIALSYIKQQGIKLIGVDAQAFIDGKIKLILGTIWLLIHKFEISDISESALHAKDGLLLWCTNKTAGYKNVKVENFHNSWQDGLAFCALIHKHRPDLLKFDSLDPANREENLKLAFDVAEKHLDIPKLLDPEDIIGIPKPDERSMITYLSQLFQKFANTQKSELSIRRIERVIALTEMNDRLKADYTQRAQKMVNWIANMTNDLQQRNFGATSADVEDKLTLFLKYKTSTKTQQTASKLDLEGLYNNISTKLWADSRPPYVPAEGLATKDINGLWEQLNETEKTREEALRIELERLHKLEYFAKKFAGKADIFDAWLVEKREYLMNSDLGNSLHTVQSKIRRHEAFTAQWATHQIRLKELKDNLKEIIDLGNTVNKEEEKRIKKINDSWNELSSLSETKKNKLNEKLEFYSLLDKNCTEFSRKAEDLHVWLETVTESLADPVVVNSAPAVQALLDILDATKKQQLEKYPSYEELSSLSEEITGNGIDLNNISEYNIKQITQKWKSVAGRVEARKRELNMEMIKHTRSERLRQDFAKKCKEFTEWVDEQKAVISKEGTLEEKLLAVQKRFEDREAGEKKLSLLEELNQLLVDAHITDLSGVTEHTMGSLVVLHDQYVNLLKDKIRLLESQIAAKKMAEITPEQLQEFKVTFTHFDIDGDNKLSIHEFRAGCAGLGIDMSESELKTVADELNLTDAFVYFDQFVQFMVSRTQIRDTFEEVLASFVTLSGGKDFMADELVKQNFKEHAQEYLMQNMPKTNNGRDYSTFASSLFER